MDIQFTWTPAMSVGDEKLDQQHQHLLEQVNSLLDAIAGGQNNLIVIEQVLKFLDQYIQEHFTDEEKYMQEHQYTLISRNTARFTRNSLSTTRT